MTFFLVFHISIAFSSMLVTSVLYKAPSPLLLKTSYLFVFLTTVTGIVLILNMSENILGTCFFGLAYISVVLFGIYLGRKKLLEFQ